MNRSPILEVCARLEGHPEQQRILRDLCSACADWHGLLEQAETEGMAPLLRKHLIESECCFPSSVRRSLNILFKRHQHQAAARLIALQEVLQLFQRRQLTPIIIKGAALCHTLYPDPALRPMRDIDILLPEEEVHLAQTLLVESGFTPADTPISPDHYHLSALHRTVNEVSICIELHRGLYPQCPPYYPEFDFEQLHRTAFPFKIGSQDALTFNHEEMLHYLYQHGFRAPLPYESYKLINAADIIAFTERHYQQLNWKEIHTRFPLLEKTLPAMHHISPWNFERIPQEFVPQWDRNNKLAPIPFTGWPNRRFKELANRVPLTKVVADTFLPPRWWTRVYYGRPPWPSALMTTFITHPRHVLWWVYIYAHFVIPTEDVSCGQPRTIVSALKQLLISTRNKILGVYRKVQSLK